MKKAWILTHDMYIDRRIYFFIDILSEHGYDIRMFANIYFDAIRKDDPSYVIRPEKIITVREYDIPHSQIDDTDKKIVSEIISYQDRYYIRHAKWTKKTVQGYKNVSIILCDNDYSIAISKENGITVYNRSSDSWMRIHLSDYYREVLDCEKVLSEYFSGNSINKIEEKYKTEIEVDEKNKMIWVHPQNRLLLYVYDCEHDTLFEHSPIQESRPYADNNFGEQKYNDFLEEICDYSGIFLCIKDKLAEEKPDLIYVADLTTLPIAIMLKEKYGCKIIMDCHEWWYKNTVLWDPSNLVAQELSKRYEEELYPKCDLRITVGRFIASRMEELIGCKFEVIYSCISRNLETHEDNNDISIKKKYNLPDNSRIAIFQGFMSTHKNLENLARATKYLDSDSYLLLLTTDEYQETFKKLLEEEGKPDRVIWGGWIPQKELLKYTSNADLGVIPYTAVNDYAECFVPNKLMEYITARVPILFDESLKELKLVVGGNEIGYGTNLKDVAVFGKALNELLHDDSRLGMYRSNFHKCDEVFSYTGQRRSFEKMLKDYKILEE